MPRHSSSLVLILGLAIAGSPLLAAPSPHTASPRAPGSVQATATAPSPVAQLWHHLTSLWAAIGCTADPDGVKCASGTAASNPVTVTATTPTDIGCGADPDGAH